VAALYISIFSSIPLVGYAMIMDNFVFCLFILLLATMIAHIVTFLLSKSSHVHVDDTRSTRIASIGSESISTLSKRHRRLHIRHVLVDLITLFGRYFMPLAPFIVALYYFSAALSTSILATIATLMSTYAVIGFPMIIIYSRHRLFDKMEVAIHRVREDLLYQLKPLWLDVVMMRIWEMKLWPTAPRESVAGVGVAADDYNSQSSKREVEMNTFTISSPLPRQDQGHYISTIA
jgi:hypothetical protein